MPHCIRQESLSLYVRGAIVGLAVGFVIKNNKPVTCFVKKKIFQNLRLFDDTQHYIRQAFALTILGTSNKCGALIMNKCSKTKQVRKPFNCFAYVQGTYLSFADKEDNYNASSVQCSLYRLALQS